MRLDLFLLLLILAGSNPISAPALEVPPELAQGLQHVRHARYQQALDASRSLQPTFAGNPLLYLIRAEAYWGLLYCEAGDITSEHVWHVARKKSSAYDNELFQATEQALEAGRRMRQDAATAALGALYSGLARGVRGRLYAFRRQSLKSASEAKRMRADLLEAIAKDSQLAPEAYLGLGAYNYYADALSPLLKFIRFFLGIPGGDRQEGLRQLRIAASDAALLSPEAQFELSRIYGIREGRHADALSWLQKLSEQYPENGLYSLAAAYQAEQAGQKTVAAEFIRKAEKAAREMEAPCRQRIGAAARSALERLQGRRTPDAVPTSGGYFYQYANLTFNKNCNPGDTCNDTPQWSEIDPYSQITLSCTSCSSPVLRSAGTGTCIYDTAIKASIGGLETDLAIILVDSPTSLASLETQTFQLGSADPGYETRKTYVTADACSNPGPWAIPSVALREQFGAFQKPGVITGWSPDPPATSSPNYNNPFGIYTWFDYIYANDESLTPQWNPDPQYNNPPISNTVIVQAPQSWYIGSQTPGAGQLVFSGTIHWYQDNGDAY